MMDERNHLHFRRLLRITLCITLLLCESVSSEERDTSTQQANGIVTIQSQHSVTVTIDRLESALRDKGMTIFKRISHSTGAESVGLRLRPTALLIFGNPKVGTPLMQCAQTIALDLPQKMLAYEDSEGKIWLAYNDPLFIANRHNAKDCKQQINRVSNALKKFSSLATN